ncbi:MAG: L-rhamnose isomerase [Promethearchaeota archaeon]
MPCHPRVTRVALSRRFKFHPSQVPRVSARDVEIAFEVAKAKYERLGVDVERAMELLDQVHLSLPCWQGDDVGGFEGLGGATPGGGIQATGNYPGKARNPEELRRDLDAALSLIPGTHRVNLHAMYGEFDGERVDRDQVAPEHFEGWVDWASSLQVGLDFNATLFAHQKASSGLTLSSKDRRTREFWKEHVKRAREIAATFGRRLGSPAVHDLWIPDGYKDSPVDRAGHRWLLLESLDEIYAERHDRAHLRDAVEGKLFGIGSEAFVVGSHEFYLGYAISRGLWPCLDAGHFHPTESVADKVSAIMPFVDGLLLHVSRGVRWDSDHVPVVDDALLSLAQELVRGGWLGSVAIALDFFDASINRVGAWVLGSRATLRALLRALLEPREILLEAEREGKFLDRLALLERLKDLPHGAVWDAYCLRSGVPVGQDWLAAVANYEREVLAKRQ